MANDAARSYRSGGIVSFDESPMTIADGARTLHISPRTFAYLRQLAGFYEVSETDIVYWTQWLMHLLKISVETTPKRALVILSGGNIGAASMRLLWQDNHLETKPTLGPSIK